MAATRYEVAVPCWEPAAVDWLSHRTTSHQAPSIDGISSQRSGSEPWRKHGMRCGQYSVEEHRKVEELTYAPCATRERGISVRPSRRIAKGNGDRLLSLMSLRVPYASLVCC